MHLINFVLCRLHRAVHDEEGVTALEYGLIAALIAVAIVATVTTLGTTLNTLFTKIAADL